MNTRTRVGHTRWKAILYEPGQVQGYDDRAIAIVVGCRVTAVVGSSVHYTTSDNQHYIAGVGYWQQRTLPTFRKACADAKRKIKEWEDAHP